MLPHTGLSDTLEIVRAAIDTGVHIIVSINNRFAGNAPSIARIIADRLGRLLDHLEFDGGQEYLEDRPHVLLAADPDRTAVLRDYVMNGRQVGFNAV